jgi:hypothetical protein
MKIYFAGNIGPPREGEYKNLLTKRLFSFYNHGPNGRFNKEYKVKGRAN